MTQFSLSADHQPAGSQPDSIRKLTEGIRQALPFQTLLGVTGSGKTFTMANVIEKVQKPTLVLSHNKTLAAQLYGEFMQYFPKNLVEYFISYYDYYQPEAYLPLSGTYIEKEMTINEEIDKLRLRATSSLLSGRQDVIVVASVSCIYGLGNPSNFRSQAVELKPGQRQPMSQLLYRLVDLVYKREDKHPGPGCFRVKGDTLEVFVPYGDYRYRIIFWQDQIESLVLVEGAQETPMDSVILFPTNLFLGERGEMPHIVREIEEDLEKQLSFLDKEGRQEESQRLGQRVQHDLSMIRELGYCSGIENYSRYFDRRNPGERPFCLLDYFPDDYLLIVDESHVTLPQVRAMWGGDRARKENLVQYGFRLPSALDNRPLTFDEFQSLLHQTLFVSATPGDYEIAQSGGSVVEQIIRPTGLLDPEIEVRPTKNQMDSLIRDINHSISKHHRVLITTTTKRLAEEMAAYFGKLDIKARYLHADIKAMERVDLLAALREGQFDVLVGVNLLREGLDLPEVSLVAIMDADKQGFLRNERSLIQMIGRASRNRDGKVIMYADQITNAMQRAVDETHRRRTLQQAYNQKHNITPKTIQKNTQEDLFQRRETSARQKASAQHPWRLSALAEIAENPLINRLSDQELAKLEKHVYKKMCRAAEEERYEEAMILRDDWKRIQRRRQQLKEKVKKQKKRRKKP